MLTCLIHAGTCVYNAYIDGLLKGRNSQKALQVFEKLKRDHCEPSTKTYTMLINLYGKVISVLYLYLVIHLFANEHLFVCYHNYVLMFSVMNTGNRHIRQ